MLYVTTRNNQDTFTANHVLTNNRAADGGLFLPKHLPLLSDQEKSRLLNMPFGQCVAEVLNLFYSTKLTGWDIDFSIGRYPVRLHQLSNRILMAETWHNPQWQYKYLENNLMQLIQAQADLPGNWNAVAIQMAVIIGILGNRDDLGLGPVDIAAISGDFTIPTGALYLRKMGFPIGNIICCCNENNQFWELICNGQMRTDGMKISTIVPEADVTLPVNLERLIFECGGFREVADYLSCNEVASVYYPSEGMLQRLRDGLFVSVVSSSRVETTIPNVYKTHNYLLAPGAALAYSGLMDYRAKTGINRTALVICENSPRCAEDTVAKVMGLSVADLKKQM